MQQARRSPQLFQSRFQPPRFRELRHRSLSRASSSDPRDYLARNCCRCCFIKDEAIITCEVSSSRARFDANKPDIWPGSKCSASFVYIFLSEEIHESTIPCMHELVIILPRDAVAISREKFFSSRTIAREERIGKYGDMGLV